MSNGVSVEVPVTERNCGNCACFFKVVNPADTRQSQGFCRLNPAETTEVRVEVPRIAKDGKPMLRNDGRTPQTDIVKQMAYLYQPTIETNVCFAGWRPIGTRPGDEWREGFLTQILEPLLEHAKLEPDGLERVRTVLSLWRAGPSLPPPPTSSGS